LPNDFLSTNVKIFHFIKIIIYVLIHETEQPKPASESFSALWDFPVVL